MHVLLRLNSLVFRPTSMHGTLRAGNSVCKPASISQGRYVFVNIGTGTHVVFPVKHRPLSGLGFFCVPEYARV